MKKLLLGMAVVAALITPALAADLRRPVTKAPVAAPPPVFSWTGCYIGAHVGGGWGDKDWTFEPPNPPLGPVDAGSHNVSGVLAGGQIGCDIQSGAWVFGAEFQGSWTNIDGKQAGNVQDPPEVVSNSEIDWIFTATGRVGYAVNTWLFYVKGGAAWAREHFFVTDTGVLAFDDHQTRTGWLVGGGIEYSLGANWSAKLEYNYIDFGDKTVFAATTAPVRIDQALHTLKFGINYRFGGPVVARY